MNALILRFVWVCCVVTAALLPLRAFGETVELRAHDTTVFCAVGDILQVRGKTNDNASYSMEVNGVASQNDRFQFDWTAQSPGDYQIVVRENDDIVRQIHVIVPSVPPVSLANLPAAACDQADVCVASNWAGAFLPSKVDYYLDGALAASALRPPFFAHIPLKSASTGQHALTMDATSMDGGRYQRTSYINIFSNLVEVQPQDDTAYCVAGDVVRIAGRGSASGDSTDYVLTVNGQVVQKTPAACSDGTYSFDWSPTDRQTGDNRITVKIYDVTGAFVLAKRLHVVVSPAPPVEFANLADATTSVLDLSVVQPGDAPFAATSVAYFLNGQKVAESTRPPFAARVSVASQAPGAYAVTLLASGQNGEHYQHTRIFTVPERITAAGMPPSVVYSDGDGPFGFHCELAPDFKPSRVCYYFGAKAVAVGDAAPFDAAADLSGFDSGVYPVTVRAFTDSGLEFDSPPMAVDFRNKAADNSLHMAQTDVALAQTKAGEALMARRQAEADAGKAPDAPDEVRALDLSEGAEAAFIKDDASAAKAKADAEARSGSDAATQAAIAEDAANDAEKAAVDADRIALLHPSAAKFAQDAHAQASAANASASGASQAAQQAQARADADQKVADAAQAQAAAAARTAALARQQAIRLFDQAPRIPTGPLALACANAIVAHLASNQRGIAAENRIRLQEICDIKKVRSAVYDYQVYATLDYLPPTGSQLQTEDVIALVNSRTGEVSDYVRPWTGSDSRSTDNLADPMDP